MGLNLGNLAQGALSKVSTLVSPASLSRVESKLPGKIKAGVGIGTFLAGLLGNPQKAQGEGLRSSIMNFIGMLGPVGGVLGGDVPSANSGESPAEIARAMAAVNAQSSPVANNQPSISAPSSERTPSGPVPVPGKSTSSFSQTPQSGAPAVSPTALAQIASIGGSGAPGAPGGSPTPFSAPAPATLSLARSFNSNAPTTGIQAAVLRRLAERGNKQAPAGYVGIPEAMPIGAAPRRRLRDNNY